MRSWFYCLLLGTLLGGCDTGNTQLAQQSLIYCAEGPPLTFNPQLVTSSVTLDATAHQLYDRLLNMDFDNLEPVPALASAWQRSADGLSYRFTLRQNVAWHQTPWFSPSRKLTAEDVLFTFGRLTDPEHPYHAIGGGYPYFSSIGLADLIREVRVENDYQVVFELTRPDASFLSYLTTDYAVILSAEYGQQQLELGAPEQLDELPVGTGPFKLSQYRTDEYIRYLRHPDYWQGSPRLEQLVFDITPQSSKRLAKLLTGECDVMAYPSASQLRVIKDNPALGLNQETSMNVALLSLNIDKPPFDDLRVRKAISLALSRQDILHAVYFDMGSMARTVLPPVSWGHHADLPIPAADPARARWLLRQAGFGDGFEMELWVSAAAHSFNPDGVKTGQLIQRQLGELGIKVRLVPLEEPVMRSRLAEGHQDAVLTGWDADSPDPDNMLRSQLSCPSIAAGTNTSRWCEPVFDQQLDLALQTPLLSERVIFYQRAQRLIQETVPVIPLAHSLKLQAYRRQVKDLRLPPFGGVSFHGVYKE